jgi:hypothetical protein
MSKGVDALNLKGWSCWAVDDEGAGEEDEVDVDGCPAMDCGAEGLEHALQWKVKRESNATAIAGR